MDNEFLSIFDKRTILGGFMRRIGLFISAILLATVELPSRNRLRINLRKGKRQSPLPRRFRRQMRQRKIL